VSFAIITAVTLPIFQRMGVSGNDYQLAAMVANSPWSTKGFIGVLSDCFPLGRYHKRGYLQLFSAVGLLGGIGLAVAPTLTLTKVYLWPVTGLIFMVSLQYSTLDLLSEGKYAEIMRESGAGSEILSLVWVCINIGGLVGAAVVYMLVDGQLHLLVSVALIPAAIAAVMVARGAMPEKPARGWEIQRAKILSQPKLFLLAVYMAGGVLIISVTACFGSALVRLIVTIAVTMFLSGASFHALPRTLAKCNFYMMLVRAACVDISGTLAYFYTSGQACVPGGPGFSYRYYLAVSSVVGAVGGSLGSIMFQGMNNWSFQAAFRMTTFVQVLASAFDLVIVNRWNLQVGLSDQATYLFGDAACQQMAAMLCLMPMALLSSRLCPRGAEATVYAILAGFQNFGSNVGSVVGVWLTEVLGITTAGAVNPNERCNFDNLNLAIILAHVVLPLAVLPLTNVLVPSERMDDESAFAIYSPAPSFCSPASSAASSPRVSPTSSQGDPKNAQDIPWQEDTSIDYERLPDGPPGLDIFMTGFTRGTTPSGKD